MKKLFGILLLLLLFLIPWNSRSLAADKCTIQNPVEVQEGTPFTIVVSGPNYGTNVNWTLSAYPNGGTLGEKKGKLPQSFEIKQLTPGTYSFLVAGTITGVNPATGGGNPANCASKNTTTVKPSANTTPTTNLCWIVNPAIRPGEAKSCINTCDSGNTGQYATEEECKGNIPQSQEGQACDPNATLPCVTGTVCKPTSADGKWACKKGSSSSFDPKLPCVGGSKDNCTQVNTAIGPISTSPAGFIKSLFSILLGLAGGIALILIIISGYRLMTSQGNPEQVQGAREMLTSAIVGLLFIIFSLVILQVIGVSILHIPGFG